MNKTNYQPGDLVVFLDDNKKLPAGMYPSAGTIGQLETVDYDGGLWIRWPNDTRSCCSPFRVRKVETFAPGDKVLFRPAVKDLGTWSYDVPKDCAMIVSSVRDETVRTEGCPYGFHASWLIHAPAEKKPGKRPKIIVMRGKKDPSRVVAKDLCTGTIAVARCHPRDDFDFHTGAALAFSRLLRALGADPFVLSSDTCGTNPGKPDPSSSAAKPRPERRPCTKFKVGDYVVGNVKANEYGTTKEGWRGRVVKILDRPQFQPNGVDMGSFVDIIVRGKVLCTGSEVSFTVNSDRFDLAPKLYNARIVCISTNYPEYFTVGKIYTVKDGRLTWNDERHITEGLKSLAEIHNLLSARFIEITGEA